jgi:hypothetical protein
MEGEITQGIIMTYTMTFNDDISLDKAVLPNELTEASDDGVIKIQ